MIYLLCVMCMLSSIGYPLCYYLGSKHGAMMQFRAQRGIRPIAAFERPQRAEVHGEEPTEDPRLNDMAEMKAELEKLPAEAIKDRCEFYNVPWDDRQASRSGVLSAIVNAHFNPGVYRA